MNLKPFFKSRMFSEGLISFVAAGGTALVLDYKLPAAIGMGVMFFIGYFVLNLSIQVLCMYLQWLKDKRKSTDNN